MGFVGIVLNLRQVCYRAISQISNALIFRQNKLYLVEGTSKVHIEVL